MLSEQQLDERISRMTLMDKARQLAQVTAHYYDRSDRSHDASRL